MSGGYFNYIQYSMDDAAVTIEEKIKDYQKTCLPETLEKMEIAAGLIAEAGRMLHRIDLFVSGDEGEDSFNKRWVEGGFPSHKNNKPAVADNKLLQEFSKYGNTE